MDSWYATKSVLLHIESLGKQYYCPLKSNRRVDDSNARQPYQRIDALEWTVSELRAGKRIKIRGFPKNHKVKVFRVASSSRRTDYVVTNDLNQIRDVHRRNGMCLAFGRLNNFTVKLSS